MSVDLDESYFEWLYSLINPVRQKNPARTYWKLFRILYGKEFTWTITMDENRAGDGVDLRHEWIRLGENPDDVDKEWLEMDCSFLEFLIALSRRAAFLTSEDPAEWFWRLLENLGLRRYSDLHSVPKDKIEEILDIVLERTYSRTGKGGLFPMRNSSDDQREVEIWYQLQKYVFINYFS